FLNRRGFSFFVQCKDCGFIFECPHCSVSLTLHEKEILTCHYCEHTRAFPKQCPECKKKEFIKKGIGTQQVVTILEKLFPYAHIGRADMDTTRKKTVWKETLSNFESGKLNILVGTQTITKGFHFPGVTLVGILWADLNLHFPVYNATETTLQQLIQVAGRAGRQSQHSTVIVQTMDDHPVFAYLNETDYLRFYSNEIKKRELLSYPPYGRLAELELRHTDQQLVESESAKIAANLIQIAQKHDLPVQVMGPAEPPVSKVKKTHIRKIYLKSKNLSAISVLFVAIKRLNGPIKLLYTPNQSS
ncbi:primosomal protein N', partial [bacterium]|nr:primosomal protein N' [bacterium]